MFGSGLVFGPKVKGMGLSACHIKPMHKSNIACIISLLTWMTLNGFSLNEGYFDSGTVYSFVRKGSWGVAVHSNLIPCLCLVFLSLSKVSACRLWYRDLFCGHCQLGWFTCLILFPQSVLGLHLSNFDVNSDFWCDTTRHLNVLPTQSVFRVHAWLFVCVIENCHSSELCETFNSK